MQKSRGPCSHVEPNARVRLRFVLWIAAVLFFVGGVQAATVALLRPSSDIPSLDEALFRLKGELLAVGANVVLLDAPIDGVADSDELDARLELTAREREIDAFIEVTGSETPDGANVWLLEPPRAHFRLYRVALGPSEDNRAATLAIRTIEVMRSRLLAIDWAAAQERRALASPPPSPRPAPPAMSEHSAPLGLELGATALVNFGEIGPAVLPFMRADWALSTWLSLQSTAAGFGSRPRIETAAGHVDVQRAFGLLGLCICTPSLRGVHPLVALSLGAVHTALDGQADASYLGHRVDKWALLLDAGAGARIGLPARVYLTMTGHVQLAEPYVAVHVVDAVVAITGHPNVLLTFTVGVRP